VVMVVGVCWGVGAGLTAVIYHTVVADAKQGADRLPQGELTVFGWVGCDCGHCSGQRKM
jgi:hypothetical protein